MNVHSRISTKDMEVLPVMIEMRCSAVQETLTHTHTLMHPIDIVVSLNSHKVIMNIVYKFRHRRGLIYSISFIYIE